VADDRNGVVGQTAYGSEARAAIDGVSGRFVEPKGPAHEVFRAADFIEIVAGHREDPAQRREARIEHQVGRHGYNVDAGAPAASSSSSVSTRSIVSWRFPLTARMSAIVGLLRVTTPRYSMTPAATA
jgi:hypothetical protein